MQPGPCWQRMHEACEKFASLCSSTGLLVAIMSSVRQTLHAERLPASVVTVCSGHDPSLTRHLTLGPRIWFLNCVVSQLEAGLLAWCCRGACIMQEPFLVCSWIEFSNAAAAHLKPTFGRFFPAIDFSSQRMQRHIGILHCIATKTSHISPKLHLLKMVKTRTQGLASCVMAAQQGLSRATNRVCKQANPKQPRPSANVFGSFEAIRQYSFVCNALRLVKKVHLCG